MSDLAILLTVFGGILIGAGLEMRWPHERKERPIDQGEALLAGTIAGSLLNEGVTAIPLLDEGKNYTRRIRVERASGDYMVEVRRIPDQPPERPQRVEIPIVPIGDPWPRDPTKGES